MPFDLALWNKYACACRCLIELQRRNETHIKPEDIYNRYIDEYPVWKTKPGTTDAFLLSRIIMDFEIAATGAIYSNPQKLIEEAKDCIGILGFTELMPDEAGKLSEKYHVMIVWPRDEEFKIWNPLADGNAEEGPASWNDWYEWRMHGLVLV